MYGEYHAWIKRHACIVASATGHRCFGGITGHHVRHVGNGGQDFANEVPVCAQAHTEIHTGGAQTFEAKYGVELETIAFQLAEVYRREEAKRRREERWF